MKLQTKGTPSRVPAWVHIKRRKRNKRGQPFWEVVHAKGHLDEVQALSKQSGAHPPPLSCFICRRRSAARSAAPAARLMKREASNVASAHEGRARADAAPATSLELIEGKVLGGGAFSRVSKVIEESHSRAYALKRMRKATVLQCPEHVFCEQVITRNTAHPFCIRQVRAPAAAGAYLAADCCFEKHWTSSSCPLHGYAPCTYRPAHTAAASACRVRACACSTRHSRTSTTSISSLTCCPAATSWTSWWRRRAW